MAMRQTVGPEGFHQTDLQVHLRILLGDQLQVLRPHAHRDRLPGQVAEIEAAGPQRHPLLQPQFPAPLSDTTGQEVHRRRADEPRDEAAGRPVVDCHRRVDLLRHPRIHHDQPVGQRHRLHLIVRDVKRGGPQAALKLLDFQAHLHTQLGVQVGQGLVEQEGAGVANDGPPHRDTLPLAAGELAGLALQEVRQLQHLGRLLHPLLDLRPAQLRDLQTVGHVVVDAHVRVERVVLEHHGDVPVLGLQIVDHLAADGDLALADRLQSGHHAQQGGLAAARGSDDDDELAVGDLHVDPVDHLRAAVAFLHLGKADLGHLRKIPRLSLLTRPTFRSPPDP